jgi:hypothetical protein
MQRLAFRHDPRKFVTENEATYLSQVFSYIRLPKHGDRSGIQLADLSGGSGSNTESLS